MKKINKTAFIFLTVLIGIVIIYNESGGKPIQEKQLYKYVGLEKCASVCHNNNELGFQYDIVRNSKHAKAYSALESKKARMYANKAKVSGEPDKSQTCLQCHTTGSGNGPDSFADTYKREDGVTCEACHKSAFNPKTVLPGEQDCRKCHNDSIHKVAEFNYSERVARIAHPRPKLQSN